MQKYQVLLNGENVWTINGEAWFFDSEIEAIKELEETFSDMDSAGMDYEPSEYRIEAV